MPHLMNTSGTRRKIYSMYGIRSQVWTSNDTARPSHVQYRSHVVPANNTQNQEAWGSPSSSVTLAPINQGAQLFVAPPIDLTLAYLVQFNKLHERDQQFIETTRNYVLGPDIFAPITYGVRATYEALAHACVWAARGSVLATAGALSEANCLAAWYGVWMPNTELVTRKSYSKALVIEMQYAQTARDLGNVRSMYRYLINIDRYASEAREPPPCTQGLKNDCDAMAMQVARIGRDPAQLATPSVKGALDYPIQFNKLRERDQQFIEITRNYVAGPDIFAPITFGIRATYEALARACVLATKGSIKATASALSEANCLAVWYGVQMPDTERITSKSYSEALVIEMECAKTASKLGSVRSMEYCLNNITTYASKAPEPRPITQHIEDDCYTLAMQVALAAADQLADGAYEEAMQAHIRLAKGYAENIGRAPLNTSRIEEKCAANKTMFDHLANASRAARHGNDWQLYNSLQLSRFYAEKAGRDIRQLCDAAALWQMCATNRPRPDWPAATSVATL